MRRSARSTRRSPRGGNYIDTGDPTRISGKITSMGMRDHRARSMFKLNLDLEAPTKLVYGSK